MKLEEHPFISSIGPADLPAVVDRIEVLDFGAGEPVFAENSAADAMFLILAGRILFTKAKPSGDVQPVSEAGEGAFFGEVGIFTGEPRALGASAASDARLARLPKDAVERLLASAPGPINKVLESVILHLRGTTTQYLGEIVRNEKLALVGTMVSSLLHDFKNPFAAISLGAQLIKQLHPDDARTAGICDRINDQIVRMVAMANDIGAFSRGEDAVEYTAIEVAELFAAFRDLNRPFFEDPDITAELSAGPLAFEGDAIKLQRVLQNLVSNAFDALRQSGRGKGYIRIAAEADGEDVLLTVADNGPGIPEEIRASFFEPFVTHGKPGGTGLGTAIAKSIVAAHGGVIRFDTSGEGTVFTIRLPRERPPERR